jgi:hypothetical protein
MSETRAPVPGACLCGAVRFQVTLPTKYCVHCHCTLCQRSHGAGFVTWLTVPRGQLEVQSGGDQLTRYPSSDHGSRSFCAKCGSSLFCELDEHPDDVDIVLANLSGPIDLEPQMHIFFSDRAPWVEVHDALPRLGGASGMEPLDEP